MDDRAVDDLLSLSARLADLQRWAMDIAIKGRLSSGRAEEMVVAIRHCEGLVGRLQQKAPA